MPRRLLTLSLLAGAILAGCGDGTGPGVGARNAKAISAAADYSCAIDGENKLWCWGAGGLGRLGNGDTLDSRIPVAVVGGHSVKQLTAGSFHSCALTSGGQAWCWGTNFTGVLGIGSITGPEPTPVLVTGGHNFKSLSAG